HLGAPAEHLVFLASAAGLVADHHDRTLPAFEHDPVVLFAVLDAGGKRGEVLGQIVDPHFIRRIEVRIRVDDASADGGSSLHRMVGVCGGGDFVECHDPLLNAAAGRHGPKRNSYSRTIGTA